MSFSKLSEDDKRKFVRLCNDRKKTYLTWLSKKSIAETKTILIVGDMPGPKAPQTDDYHHTPFYSKLYSGGWLNSQLVLNGISEENLIWINSASWNGIKTSTDILTFKKWNKIIGLGKNAAKWCKQENVEIIEIEHPQYWRRFRSAEPYSLIEHLRT